MLNVAYPFYFTIFQREMNCYVKKKKPMTQPRTKTTYYNSFRFLDKCRLLMYIDFLDHYF